MSVDATDTGRHRLDDQTTRRRFTTRGRILATSMLVATAATAVLAAGPAMGAPPPPKPTPPPDPENSPVAVEAHKEPNVPGTPCGVSTRACVDLDSQKAWLITEGKVTGGPVTIASGGAGRETPVGHSYRVYRKEKDHKSGEFKTPDGKPSPMPFATFFADGGIAFHAGDPARSSAGCIRMERPDAENLFNILQIGDKVQVVSAKEEAKHRKELGTQK